MPCLLLRSNSHSQGKHLFRSLKSKGIKASQERRISYLFDREIFNAVFKTKLSSPWYKEALPILFQDLEPQRKLSTNPLQQWKWVIYFEYLFLIFQAMPNHGRMLLITSSQLSLAVSSQQLWNGIAHCYSADSSLLTSLSSILLITSADQRELNFLCRNWTVYAPNSWWYK